MNITDLNKLKEEGLQRLAGRRKRICVCAGASCLSSGAQGVIDAARRSLKEKGLDKDVDVVSVGCMGACNAGPLLRVDGDGSVYQKMDAVKSVALVEKHIQHGAVDPGQLLFSEPGRPGPRDAGEAPFYRHQVKIVLENSGIIDPEAIEEYVARDGYQALYKCLREMEPAEVIGEIKHSGLRGRGGAGFPVGTKWETVFRHVAEQKYVICNGDEGDPGAFMDRSVLESDPHRVLEGMAIAGYAVGASRGFLYVRGEYPLAIRRLEIAIKQARKLGLLGKNILESGFDFDVDIRIGAGAFVCGEETALIASIEGKRGTPKPRPPYPAQSGLWGKPTLINNVESFANIAPIIRNGAEWFNAIGTPKSAGTKVFALAGSIVNTGLIEVPMGTSLREIIFDIGGGIPGGKKFKAAQTGGPSGGCIPEEHLDVKVDYESLGALGSIMGSGGLIVMDESSCMVKVARYFMEFCMDESCGKCIPCRVGTKQMHGLLDKICRGEGTLEDLALLEDLAPMVKETSLCGLGQSAPNPLLSTLRYFRDEYIAHIVEKRCPAGACELSAGVQREEVRR
jgi:NADH:ubiquinone oxidoreductase subunit F (NADH-binding)/(2Fe-2S) ferredoxin